MSARSILVDLDAGGVARVTNLPAPGSDAEPARRLDLTNRVATVICTPSTTAPTTRPDGSALQDGDLWIDLT